MILLLLCIFYYVSIHFLELVKLEKMLSSVDILVNNL